MSFQWNWLFWRMNHHGIFRYFQVDLCESGSDILLYRFDLTNKAKLVEAHLIKRTSKTCYRITSYVNNEMFYESFRNANSLIDYFVSKFMLHEMYVKSFNPLDQFNSLKIEDRLFPEWHLIARKFCRPKVEDDDEKK